jgi:osmotically-inducible protein OsmY
MRKLVKPLVLALCSLSLLVTIAFAQEMQKQPAAPKAKPAKAKAAMPTSDADIQKCIQDRFANSPSMKDNLPKVSVSGGVATITGEAKNGGQKGAATRSAKSCGAKEVKNEMTVAAKMKK